MGSERHQNDDKRSIIAVTGNALIGPFPQLLLFLFGKSFASSMFSSFAHGLRIPFNALENTKGLSAKVTQHNQANKYTVHTENGEVVLLDVAHQKADGDHTHGES